jgi:hypothetical protein
MPSAARLFTSIDPDQQARFAALAEARGVSVSKLLANLVYAAVAESPSAKMNRLTQASRSDAAPAEKYTVRLMGVDAVRLEERALGRGMTASGYVAHVLRAHLRANPPMPFKEFQELKRAVNELSGIRLALAGIVANAVAVRELGGTVAASIGRLLPTLKQIRDDVQNTLVANSKSWETGDA